MSRNWYGTLYAVCDDLVFRGIAVDEGIKGARSTLHCTTGSSVTTYMYWTDLFDRKPDPELFDQFVEKMSSASVHPVSDKASRQPSANFGARRIRGMKAVNYASFLQKSNILLADKLPASSNLPNLESYRLALTPKEDNKENFPLQRGEEAALEFCAYVGRKQTSEFLAGTVNYITGVIRPETDAEREAYAQIDKIFGEELIKQLPTVVPPAKRKSPKGSSAEYLTLTRTGTDDELLINYKMDKAMLTDILNKSKEMGECSRMLIKFHVTLSLAWFRMQSNKCEIGLSKKAVKATLVSNYGAGSVNAPVEVISDDEDDTMGI